MESKEIEHRDSGIKEITSSYELKQTSSISIDENDSTFNGSLNSKSQKFLTYERSKRKFREDEIEKKLKHILFNSTIKYINDLLPKKYKLEILCGAIPDETNAFFNFILLKTTLKDILSTPNTRKWHLDYDNNINMIKQIYDDSSKIQNKDKIKDILNTEMLDIINHCRNENTIDCLKGLEDIYNTTKNNSLKKERDDYIKKYNNIEASISTYYQQKLIKSIDRHQNKLYNIECKDKFKYIKYVDEKKKKINNTENNSGQDLQKFFDKVYSYELKIEDKTKIKINEYLNKKRNSNDNQKEEDDDRINDSEINSLENNIKMKTDFIMSEYENNNFTTEYQTGADNQQNENNSNLSDNEENYSFYNFFENRSSIFDPFYSHY